MTSNLIAPINETDDGWSEPTKSRNSRKHRSRSTQAKGAGVAAEGGVTARRADIAAGSGRWPSLAGALRGLAARQAALYLALSSSALQQLGLRLRARGRRRMWQGCGRDVAGMWQEEDVAEVPAIAARTAPPRSLKAAALTAQSGGSSTATLADQNDAGCSSRRRAGAACAARVGLPQLRPCAPAALSAPRRPPATHACELQWPAPAQWVVRSPPQPPAFKQSNAPGKVRAAGISAWVHGSNLKGAEEVHLMPRLVPWVGLLHVSQSGQVPV